ncbi:ANK-REP-REGION domain-containing protein [Mycena indigotica]|uniref:ANK-REP-REGION domain-containing protein n=1 Tax=Mycena indigotica TaxID=2126181 RepID=A0A8H6SY97_9AGAR|nr:ANK-REP-REGION domain-containing protein [Mycena indigotica]KAF7307508.1 ANK-REP-REGION domain-containing protein [Mycena indigotica]
MMAVLSIIDFNKPMTVLLDLPVELILHIASSVSHLSVIDPDARLPQHRSIYYPLKRLEPRLALLPDLASINALSRTCKSLDSIVNPLLYDICSKNETLGPLSVLFAVEHQLEDVLDKLSAAGVDLDFEVVFKDDIYGLLHVAASLGDVGMVQKLLDVYGERRQTWAYGRLGLDSNKTALDLAVEYGYSDVVRVLAAILPPSAPIPLRVAPGRNDRSPLFANHNGVIQRTGSGAETRRMYIGRAFSTAARGSLEIIGALEFLGAHEDCDVDYCEDNDYNYLYPPLLQAMFKTDFEPSIIGLLLQLGANPNFRRLNDVSPLHVAVADSRSLELVKLLLDAGADINAPGIFGSTALLDSLRPRNGDPLNEIVQLLLERGADPTTADNRGETPLHKVFKLDNRNVIEDLVEKLLWFGAGSTVEKKDHQLPPNTPIAHAMRTHNIGAIGAFLPHIKNQELWEQVVQWLTSNT